MCDVCVMPTKKAGGSSRCKAPEAGTGGGWEGLEQSQLGEAWGLGFPLGAVDSPQRVLEFEY